MGPFVAKRLLQVVVVTLGVTAVVMLLAQLLPGDPARAMLGPKASPGTLDAYRVDHGLDRSPVVQYLYWLRHLAIGDLGRSQVLNEPVTSVLLDRLPKTVLLVGAATLLALLVAVPLGIYQAVRRGRAGDYAVTSVAFVLYSMPLFWLALIMVSAFAVQLHWFPAQAPQGSLADIVSEPRGLVLPVLCLMLVSVAIFTRYVRAAAIQALQQEYVRTAFAKGASLPQVLRRHVLRNSLLPVVTLVGVMLPWCVSGALVVEVVFNYPGMGLLFWSSAQAQDFPVLLGATVVVGVATALGSLLADLLYAVVDPRVRSAA